MPFFTWHAHKLIVDGIFRTGFYTCSASYAFRMIRGLKHINIHFTGIGTLTASDTFTVFNLNFKKADLVKQ